MRRVVRKYGMQRLRLSQFLGLAFFLSMLVIVADMPIVSWLTALVFLWSSFVVFRLIDDAGSVHIDRKDFPDRAYLHEENYFDFLTFTIVVAILFLIVCFLLKLKGVFILLLFIVISGALYVVFSESKKTIESIAIAKYPFLIFIAAEQHVASDDLYLPLLAGLIMVAYHTIENEKVYISCGILSICGLTTLNGCSLAMLLPLTIIPVVLYWMCRRNEFMKYLPIVYFPSLHMILLLLDRGFY